MHNKIYIGWSEKDITPTKKVALNGQFNERISSFMRDPLMATALALEVRDEYDLIVDQALIISIDLLFFHKGFQNRLREAIGPLLPQFDVQKLFINATHTHTGPYTSEKMFERFGGRVLDYHTISDDVLKPSDYSNFLITRLCEAAAEAWNSKEQGVLSWGLGHAVVGHSRVVSYHDGSYQLYGQTDTPCFNTMVGYPDHGVELLFFWDSQNDLTGIGVNVACPPQVLETQCYITADFWGELRNELSKRFSKNIYVLAMTGASGDQSPRDMIRKAKGEPKMYNQEGLHEIALRIANSIDSVLETARLEIKSDIPFIHYVEDLSLPIRTVSTDEFEQAQNEYTEMVQLYKINETLDNIGNLYDDVIKLKLSKLIGIIERYKDQQTNEFYNFELHVIRLGDIIIATNPFELFIDYGLRIKARSKAVQTFLVELCCENAGYLPTPQAIEGGCYGSFVSNGICGIEAGKILVDRTLEIINDILF